MCKSDIHSKTCLNRTLKGLKPCLNKPFCEVSLLVHELKCIWNLIQPNTCLNWTNFKVQKEFKIASDWFYCSFNLFWLCKNLVTFSDTPSLVIERVIHTCNAVNEYKRVLRKFPFNKTFVRTWNVIFKKFSTWTWMLTCH